MAEVIDLSRPKKKQKRVPTIDLTNAEPLALLTDDILKEIAKNLGPSDLARLGLADRRLRGISSVQMAEILADPRVIKLAQRYKSRLQRPFLYSVVPDGWSPPYPNDDWADDIPVEEIYNPHDTKGAYKFQSLRRELTTDPNYDREYLKRQIDGGALYRGLGNAKAGLSLENSDVLLRDQLYRHLPARFRMRQNAGYEIGAPMNQARDAAEARLTAWRNPH